MGVSNDALIGPNPRDAVIQEIVKIQQVNEIHQQTESFQWATAELATRYFGIDFYSFDREKIGFLQDLIYERAKGAYICKTAVLALIPIVGWIMLADQYAGSPYSWPTHKFVKYYKKFRKKRSQKTREAHNV